MLLYNIVTFIISKLSHISTFLDKSKINESTIQNSTIEYWIHLILEGKVSKLGLLEFKPLQESMIILPGETTLCFFRLYNPSSLNLTCLSYYLVFPESATLYITKLQCFCFNNMLIHGFETVELPILFYIDRDIIKEVFFTSKIYLYYIIIIKK